MFLNQAAFPHWVLHQKPFAPKACTPGTFTPCNFHTRGRLQQNFLQRIFTAKPVKTSSASPKRALIYMRRLLHQKGFYNRICWHQEPCTPQRASHQKAFAPNALHTKELLHRKTFCTWGTTVLFTKIFLHQEAFQRRFYRGREKQGGKSRGDSKIGFWGMNAHISTKSLETRLRAFGPFWDFQRLGKTRFQNTTLRRFEPNLSILRKWTFFTSTRKKPLLVHIESYSSIYSYLHISKE